MSIKDIIEDLTRKIVDETIKKVDNEYVVYPKKGGKRLGTHKTKKAANKQLAAIEINKEGLQEFIEKEATRLLNEVKLEDVMLQFDSKKMKKAVARNEEWDLQKVERWLKTPRFQELFQNFIPTDIQENDQAEGLQWILGLYKKGKLGSIRSWTKSLTEKYSSALELFFQQKTFMEEKQLQKLDLEGLLEVVGEARPKIKAHLDKKSYLDAEQGKKVILDDENWTILIPTNKGAACELGKGTDWCTAAPGLGYYEEYHTDEDPLTVFIPKHPDHKGEKYQIHFGSDQFMDEEDVDVSDSKKVELISLLKPVKEAFGQDIQKNLSKYAYKKFDDGREFIQDPTLKGWRYNGEPHREDGPAMEFVNGVKEWWLNGKQHRADGPAVEYADGYKEWYVNGKLHREDGPAVEKVNGHKEWHLNGKLHREDGPAVEYIDGKKYWYLNGKQHREGGPAVEKVNGTKEWWLSGKLHREDGPAVEKASGHKYWYLNGKLHREDGPAIEWATGDKEWLINGEFHREDGPAIEWANGDKEWYLNGKSVEPF